jgi:hypothetical protein
LKKLDGLTQEDLMLPFHHYQPTYPHRYEEPIIMWVMAETVEHYHDHLSWIKAIVEN